MKNVKIPFLAQLAILQQAEYDLKLFSAWMRSEHILSSTELKNLKPAPSSKLHLIRQVANTLRPGVGDQAAIVLAVQMLWPAEMIAKGQKLHAARAKLRQLQENGLTVIAIAGSYGKTSVKNVLQHTLSTQHFCFMTPESFNTPLGIAAAIERLTDEHETFIVELGEYRPGDIAQLLEFVRPDVGILTPVGFAHLDRFGNKEAMLQTFAELWQAPYAPELLLIDDQNRDLLTPPHDVWWYGADSHSRASASITSSTLEGSTGRLHFHELKDSFAFTLSLAGKSHVVNALPGLLLLEKFNQAFEPAITALHYTPAISRRLEVVHNPNGTIVIDNSYNTNPGSWTTTSDLFRSLSHQEVAIITAGFVELSLEDSEREHQIFAHDILQTASVIGILRTRSNNSLIRLIEENKSETQKLIVGNSQAEILAQIAEQRLKLDYLWLEGGCRELYQ